MKNDALLKKMGIKDKNMVKVTTPQSSTRGKETNDSELVKTARKKMLNSFLTHTRIIDGSYLHPNFKRDANNKIVRENGKNVIESYSPKSLTGQFIVEDNKDGTFTATKLKIVIW